MVVEEKLKSKLLYKIQLYLLKVLPMLIALAYLLNTILSLNGIDIPALSYIAGMSIMPLIFMYTSSYVFRFCGYHRMFLHYIVVNDIINIYDLYVGIPLDNRELLNVHVALAGLFLFLILYSYVKYNKKANVIYNR